MASDDVISRHISGANHNIDSRLAFDRQSNWTARCEVSSAVRRATAFCGDRFVVVVGIDDHSFAHVRNQIIDVELAQRPTWPLFATKRRRGIDLGGRLPESAGPAACRTSAHPRTLRGLARSETLAEPGVLIANLDGLRSAFQCASRSVIGVDGPTHRRPT